MQYSLQESGQKAHSFIYCQLSLAAAAAAAPAVHSRAAEMEGGTPLQSGCPAAAHPPEDVVCKGPPRRQSTGW